MNTTTNIGPPRLTRRALTFAAAGAAAGAPAEAAAAERLDAGQAISRIQSALGAAWRDEDGLIIGAASARVRGVSIVATPTIGAIQEAERRRLNLMIALESPLYARPGDANSPFAASAAQMSASLAEDPVYRGKVRLSERSGVSIARVSASPSPEFLNAALAAKLGWIIDPDHPGVYRMPSTRLREVIGATKGALGLNGGLRHIGDPELRVTSAVVVAGKADVAPVIRAMRDVDLLVCGDVREWEIVEYIFDSSQAGRPKALIALGRRMSLQPGVEARAQWLRALFAGLPVQALECPDPYWRLAQ